MSNVIINADDFGANQTVNKAIVSLLTQNKINSTTLMANMPGFDEAIDLAHRHNLRKNIGAHLVLTDGEPLTKEIKTLSYLFNENYRSSRSLLKRLFFISQTEKSLIYNEYSAQIEKIKKAGINITHIDTHHHLHEIWPINNILINLTKKYKIPFLRIPNNLESKPSYKKIYRNLLSKRAKILNINHSDFFGSQVDFIFYLDKYPNFPSGHKIEIMVHPDYNASDIIIDKVGSKELDFSFLNFIAIS